MDLNTDEKSLKVLKALACQTRLDIINLISKQPMNQSKLAESLNISTAVVSGHIKKLEKAGIINVIGGTKGLGKQHICRLATNSIEISLNSPNDENCFKYSIPVGLYSKHKVLPTCGMVCSDRLIGQFDDPMVFFDSSRSDAKMIWFTEGYVEYIVPNKLSDVEITAITISAELASEHPVSNNVWPSEISFFINNIRLGSWISPGNYSDRRGKYTPTWWGSNVSQYGLLKTIKIDSTGSFIDSEKMSDVTIDMLGLDSNRFNLRFAVEETANPVGGLTILGKGYGDYDQDIEITTYYEK